MDTKPLLGLKTQSICNNFTKHYGMKRPKTKHKLTWYKHRRIKQLIIRNYNSHTRETRSTSHKVINLDYTTVYTNDYRYPVIAGTHRNYTVEYFSTCKPASEHTSNTYAHNSSSINRERLLFNTHSKPKKCDFEFRFCQKCYKPPQNIKSVFSRQEKNRLIHSTEPNVQTAKNIEVTGSTTKREIIEVTQINTQTGHSQHRTPATTSNKMDALQSCDRCMSKSREQSMAEQSRTPPHGSTLCHSQKEITLPKTTPYGPNNLPHMVLCTKKGPDNA